ncbi:MAG: site-specific integrase [Chloroflexota bacterium]|nr:site-specific integrase [Chloroflexota bacterium]
MPRHRKKSVHGSGSVFQRKDGRYVAKYIDPETGKPLLRYARKESEAYELLEQMKSDVRQGTMARGPRQKVKDYMATWLEEVQKPKLRPGTYVVQRSIVYHHIIPMLGEIELKKLTPRQVQKFYTDKESEGLEKVSVRNIHRVLHTALGNAVRWGLVSQNVSDKVAPPQAQKRKLTILSKEQLNRLIQVAGKHENMDAFIKLAVTTGMRHSEMLALQWDDIDFETNILQVRRSVAFIGGQGFISGSPKTESGERVIMLPQLVIRALHKHKERQEEQRKRCGERWKNKNLVFCNKHGEYMYLSDNLSRYRKVLAEAGLPPITMHSLRHNVATFLINVLKYPPSLVQALLGHSSAAITLNIYTHTDDPLLLQQIMNDLDGLFGGE